MTTNPTRTTCSHRTVRTACIALLTTFLPLAGITTTFAGEPPPVLIPTPTLHWGLDAITAFTDPDTSATSNIVLDSAGNSNNGSLPATGSNLTASTNGILRGSLTGFTSETSRVFYGTGITNPLATSTKISMSLWLKNPGSQERNIIAGLGANTSSGNNSVQLWVSAEDADTHQRKLGLTWGDWNGQHTVYLSDAFTWEADTWYHFAAVFSKTATKQIYSYTVYLTKENETGLGTPIFSGLTPDTTTGPATGAVFYVGAQPRSYSNTKPNPLATGGYFGGNIDEVSLWLGAALTQEQLNADFLNTLAAAASTIPEPATFAALCGLAGLFATIVIRRRHR
ncbi:hypothetical protein Ga0100231_013755 [Opitutaceae bacterium TAV4]|nr:hypothetical protein Ga0100231_013755 [Opitutaceae bacterium TAV4]RRJ99473.1 hypothetical protein Ga0100230_015105 [Opitutaceae bacterium TAV3]